MIEQAEAEALFKPHAVALHRAIHEAWRKVNASDIRFTPRGRANAMWDEMFHVASNEWAGSNAIRIEAVHCGQSAEYWIRDDVMFRLKKADRYGYTRNYPTTAALRFHEPPEPPGTQLALFGPEIRFEVAYVLNRDGTAIDEVMVVHRTRDRIDYRFALVSQADVTELVLTQDAIEEEATENAPKTAVRLKAPLAQPRDAEDDAK